MNPIKLLASIALIVITGCKLPEQKREVVFKKEQVRIRTEQNILEEAAKNSLCTHVTPKLLKAVAKVESSFKKKQARFEIGYMRKISGTIDEVREAFENSLSRGKMQIMVKTAKAYGVNAEELEDDETSVNLAALILGKDICKTFKGDLTSGIAAYNAGPDWKKKRWEVQRDALLYAAKVMRTMQTIKG